MERIDKSRKRMMETFFFAMGSYVEQEAKKEDTWRDETFRNLYLHAKHEFVEIDRSKSLTKQIHNATDLVLLANILLAHLLEKNGMFEENESNSKNH